jgi:ATP-binding cassette subfamily C protein
MSSLIFTCIQIGLAFWLSPNITTFVLLFGLVLIYFNRRFLKRSLNLGSINFELGKSYLAGLTDQINGIKDIKSNTLEASRMGWYRSITKKMRDQQIDYIKLKTKSQMYYKIASTLLIALFIFTAVTMFNAQGGQLMLIIIIFARLWPSVAGIQGSLEQMASILPSFKAVKALQKDSKEAIEFEHKTVERLHIDKGIECRGVSFRYHKNEPIYALQNINIEILAHQMTAFVGRSGAGKSTLIDLLMGLNQPEKGTVLIDGEELTSNKLQSLRRSISYVSQEPFLFNTSIRENLVLVEEDASEEQIWEALEFSSSAEFVRKLPDGLDTVIGDRGIKLSGGERQRLVLARAILRKPSILVLDEATSSLDTENERNIQEALERLKGKMTVIVIAHRLSTIRNADQVIVLDEGKVVQRGGFSQLSNEKRTIFSSLLGDQMKASR